MKILHKSKRTVPPHPQVAELISKLLNTPNESLPWVLAEIDVWKWPRSDLNAWIKVLNKFDAVLEDVIRDYNIDNLQVNVFTDWAKGAVCEILRFERLLLENSTNRKMFNSYDRLNSLLFAADSDVLVFALNLLLRPSQQYSAQPSVSHALNISTSRLQSLAKRWPSLREHGVSLVDLVTEKGDALVDALPPDAREVNYSFYRTGPQPPAKEKDTKMDTDSPETPRKPTSAAASAGQSSGAVNIHIDEQTLASKDPMKILAETVEAYSVPNEEKFELMCRIRSATVLNRHNAGEREKLVLIRLLAIAIFGHTHPESQAQSSLFLYEPDLIIHLAELLQLDRDIHVPVQTAAIAALDALARYRGKIQEVLTAVNAGVNHGLLMALFRKTVSDVSSSECWLPHTFVEALLSFVTFLASHAAGGNMVVGAGLVPLLIQIIDIKLSRRLGVVSKTMQLVDNVLYSFQNAFQLFCAGHGVEALVNRIAHEVDFDIKEWGDETRSRELFGSYGQLPVNRAAVLKHTLRSMHRMMQSSGTAEGLRGLIDSSILTSVRKIIEYRGLFGPSVLPLAINIMATFVHNEPTSLAIIQEAGLPEVFFKALECGLEPVIEVIQAIPNALGALCLNQVGQDQLASRPSIIPGIFCIFTSERHLKVLQDKENAVLIGTAMDELIRHHPALKTPVFESIKTTLSKIEDLGNAYVAPDDIKSWYRLGVAEPPSAVQDSVMEDVQASGSASATATPSEGAALGDDPPPKHDNTVVSYIDVIGRFLEGLFQHTPHCRDFIHNTDGLDRIGRITALPCLPYDFANSVASDSLVQVVRTMTEVATKDTLTYLCKLVKDSLELTADFWGTIESGSKLLPLLDVSADQELEANQRFRHLVTLFNRITLLSDVFSTAGYAHGRAAISLLQTLMGSGSPDVVPDLGALHRACIWENIFLKAGLSARGIDTLPSPVSSPLEQSPARPSVPLPEADGASSTNGVQGESTTTPVSPPQPSASKQGGTQELNAKALKHLTHGLPSTMAPFFQAIVKLFYARRNPDPAQKKQILDSSKVVAAVLLQHLAQKDIDDKASSYGYYSVMIGLINSLIIDERTSQTSLHTVLLVAFYRAGGLTALFEVCRAFMATIDSITGVKLDERTDAAKQELSNAYGGLKVALHLLQPLMSSKPLFESGQTILVMSKDKKDTDPEYFEPHNFLVRLRLAALPLLKDLWEAPWLISAPLSVSKSVVQTVLELSNGDSEEPKAEPASASAFLGGAASAANILSRTTGPDENRIRQLTDMGFPRSAAERALARTHNNINAATELLLSHPFPLPPDPEPEPSDANEEDQDAAMADAAPSDDHPPATTEGSAQATPDAQIVAEQPVESSRPANEGESAEELRKRLSVAREPLKATIGRQALRLVDEHPSLIFDVSPAFVRATDAHQEQSVRYLVDDIKSFSPYAYDVQEQPLAMRCRLLALVLSEKPSSVTQEIATGLMESLLALLLSNPVSAGAEHPSVPKWLASHLLVTEALLTIGDQPRTITLPTLEEFEEKPPAQEDIATGPAFTEARTIVFDFCMRLLAIPTLPSDELLSILRLFVLLTRHHLTAIQFVQRQGIPLLFNRLKSSPVSGSHSYVAIILRHIVEERAVLEHIMTHEIKRYFSQPRSRGEIDTATYVRQCSSMALRDPKVFIDVSQSLCKVERPFNISRAIKLKERPSADKAATDVEAATKAEPTSTDTKMDVAEAGRSEPSGSLEAVVHFLLGELIKTAKPENEPPSDVADTSKASDSVAPASENAAADQPTSADRAASNAVTAEDQRFYSCFLMQCLTELSFSYDSCKIAFLSYSPKKRLHTSTKEAGHKHRTAALHFLLFDLITFGTINPGPSIDARNRVMTCNWAMSVIVALCMDSSSPHELKDVSPDLVSVRKFVLEAVSRAIKDLPSSEPVDARYGRLLALSDLCHRLLTVRFSAPVRKPSDENPTHIAKIMLEKNFVATLTNALAEVDLNYPNARALVASILKPLEHLTKIAIKMSRASDKSKDLDGGKDEEPVDSAGSEEEEEEEEDSETGGREETPDLYRNSALGMYSGEMEDGHFNPEDEMDEDGDDEDEDVEMDFGEETGSDDTSNTEDDGEDDLDEEGRESEEAWQDEDEEDEEDLVENDGDDDDVGPDEDEDDEDDEDEDSRDEEIMWQDLQGEAEAAAGEGEDQDEEDGAAVPIPILTGEEDEADEDEEDFRREMGILHVNDAAADGANETFGFPDIFSNGGVDPLRDGHPFFIPRRPRTAGDEDMQIFGQARNVPTAPPEATTHPLLLDASASNRLAGNSRGSRRPRNALTGGGGQAELIQNIESLIGGGAVQLFQHIMTQGRGGGAPETIRLDVPTGTLINLDGGRIQTRRPQAGLLSASLRVERPRAGEGRTEGRDFDPLLSIQRWAEEVRILHGKHVQERVSKLNQHLVLGFLPAEAERLREAKKAEEEAAARLKALKEEEAKQKAEEASNVQQTEEPAVSLHPAEASPEPPSDAQMGEESPAEAPAQPSAPVPEANQQQEQPAVDVDWEMADAPSATAPPDSTEAVEPPEVPQEPEVAQPGPSEPVERVTVTIHGNIVDITDTGIDPTFLEALPDDMREEVLNQHVRDQRAARVERPPDSQISNEFLDALPPEIRAEILQQERVDHSRRRPDADATANEGVPEEIDPASFIASLEPALRQDVLLESDEGFIQSLPSHMIAEVGGYRESGSRLRHLATRSATRSAVPAAPTGQRKPLSQKDAILLLDKAGITVLVRLLFFPQVLKKNLLFKVLVNLCENSKTRTELFNLLLSILQDGTGDLAAVDKSFAQMTVRPSKTPQQTPKSAGKQRAGSDYFSALALPNFQNEAVPDLIAQRCLEALTFIVTSNESSSLFFLTEHELPAGLRRPASKKGKGKEKQMPQTHYPIVLLLSLLDRQSLLKTPSIMESVAGLLATVTRPLVRAKDSKKALEAATASGSQTTAPAPDPIPAEGTGSASDAIPVLPAPPTGPPPLPPATPTTTSNLGANQASGPTVAPSAPGPFPEPTQGTSISIENAEEQILIANPPQIPHAVLRLIVNILTVGECSGKTFQQSLALIQHLSYIPDARDVIAQELKAKAQELGHTLYSDLEELATALQGSQGEVLASSVASKFSPASSDQAKLLRVLKTIDYMYSPKSSTSDDAEKGGDAEKVQSIYESFRFTPLWRRLGDCLAIVEQKPDTEHIATVLLPLIEALMVVCKYVGTKSASASATRALRASASPLSPTTPKESMEDLFVTFTDAHRKVLNLMVRNNPSLMSGSFSLLVNNPRVLDFDNKRNYFTQQLHRRPHAREHHGTLQLNVRRARVFEDSFQHLQRKTGDQIKYGKLTVRFYDEEGVDAGGVTREWFQILARQMFDPNNALFQPCAADRLTYQPNKNSWVNPEHLSFFKFVGRVIGKAIYDGRLLDAYFARSLYRQLLGKPVDYKDVEWVDPEYYNSLCWILENDPTALDLTFSVEADEFGRNRIVPLKEGGENLPVTQENKKEFVQLSAQYRLYSSIKDQIESLLSGFYEIIPKELVTIFNEQELELLISGTPDIDVDEWRGATEYNGYTSSDPVIVWWWRALKSFNRDERAKVLSFATGTSRVPLSGFVDLQGVQGVQRFSIHRAYGESDRLPQAHTCFNQIDLPQYSSYEMLRQQLLLAINEGGEGFGFA